MKIEFAVTGATLRVGAGVAVLALDKGVLTPAAQAVDAALSGLLSRALPTTRFTGAKGQTLDLVTGAADGPARVALVGTGAEGEITEAVVEAAAASAWKALSATGVETVVVQLGAVSAAVAAQAAYGVTLAAYRFDRYRTT